MDGSKVAQKVEALERRVRWQMRAIIGLLIAFLLNASPAFTSKWFHRLLPPKLTSINLSPDASEGNADLPDVSSHRARALRRGQSGRDFLDKTLSRWNEAPRSSKQAQQVVSDVLATRELRIVNAVGTVVAIIGSDNVGDGALVVGRADAEPVVIVGADQVGDGLVVITGTSESFAALSSDGMGVIRGSESSVNATFLGVDDEGNGLVTTLSTSGSLAVLGTDEAGDAAVLVTNRNGDLASALGVGEKGHGVLGILNASGRPIAAMAADASGNGTLGIDGGKFRAFVDASGNGVAETRGRTQNLLWSSESDSGGGGTSSGLMGDFDNDGDVDFADFLTFAANFGKRSG